MPYSATSRPRARTHDPKAEFRALLAKYGVEYDERYVWA
jgi:hypothetical protein